MIMIINFFALFGLVLALLAAFVTTLLLFGGVCIASAIFGLPIERRLGK
jgi:hypothetical protein